MVKITLRDEVKEFPKGIKLIEIAKEISEGLARAVLVAEVDGEVKELGF